MKILRYTICFFVIAASAHADNVTTFSDIDTWIGLGSQEAALVLDWNDGKEPVILGYRFDGTKSGQDMFRDIALAQADLFARVGPDGAFGRPLYGIGYDRDGDGFGISDNLGDESAIFAGTSYAETGVPDEFDTAAAANDPDDSYREGWFTGFWSYWNSSGKATNQGWLSPPLGANERVLSDGDWDGLSFDPGFTFTDPPAVTLTVPEPSSVWALVIAGGMFASRRRRR